MRSDRGKGYEPNEKRYTPEEYNSMVEQYERDVRNAKKAIEKGEELLKNFANASEEARNNPSILKALENVRKGIETSRTFLEFVSKIDKNV